jgi:hypothetical protein
MLQFVPKTTKKKHIFLIHHSYYEGHTHLTSLSPTIIFSSITQTQRVRPLSLLFFFSFKFSYPTFEMARPTPTSAHKEHQERFKETNIECHNSLSHLKPRSI